MGLPGVVNLHFGIVVEVVWKSSKQGCIVVLLSYFGADRHDMQKAGPR
jgi:hypothetical protein